MAELVVAHLVRYRNGIATLNRFLNSYTGRAAGAPHRLLIILKGFGGRLHEPFRSALGSIRCEIIHVSDQGFDIASYFRVAEQVPCRYFCFLNSFSEIRVDDWLARLSLAVSDDRVGLVGASGTWQSLKTNFLRRQAERPKSQLDRLIGLARSARYHLWLRSSFPDFPNPHIRTNAFVIERDRLLHLRRPRNTKIDNYRFESGTKGLSRTISEAGLELRVVGLNGRAYAPHEWRDSRTFWAGNQENLLVADNQSRLYDAADSLTRATLRTYAWGSAD